ncbi:MAG: hypothetical protein EXS36_19880, partial [Pedosphaera sp.]|nr:hypothetical protein [Pedosphaera sp.]
MIESGFSRASKTIVKFVGSGLRGLALSVLLPIAARELSAHAQTTHPIDIGGRKQLFIDTKFVTNAHNISLEMNPPAKMGQIMAGIHPWETGWWNGSASILEYEGKFKLWYNCSDPQSGLKQSYLCYAESTDGLIWNRPQLGLFEFQGSRANNILMLVRRNGATVFIDPKAPPAERYKLLAKMNASAGLPGPEGDGMYIYHSPDGLRWKLHPLRVLPWTTDTTNQVFYDRRIDCYVGYIRLWDPLRKVGRIETENVMAPWPYRGEKVPPNVKPKTGYLTANEVPLAFGYDDRDPIESDHYTPAGFPYPFADDAYFLFPSAYLHYSISLPKRIANDGPLDVQMAVSRDGVKFHRVARQPYIGLGIFGEPDGGSLYMSLGFLRRGNEIYQYYTGYPFTHLDFKYLRDRNVGALFAVKQRLDGFVSADAPMEGGSFSTPLV